jgi:mxaL protein
VTRPQVDAVAVIDITQSMNVPDQTLGGKPVSRLSFAKAKLDRMLTELPCGSRLGWAIFTEYRSFLLLAPLEVCEHQRELRATLQGIDGRMAWAGASEVAKGLNSGMEMVQALEDRPAIVFLTDGQESPPVNPSYRPSFTVARGAVRGLVVGVGGDVALPIPKLDPEGRPQGEWSASDVLQVDPYSLGAAAASQASSWSMLGRRRPNRCRARRLAASTSRLCARSIFDCFPVKPVSPISGSRTTRGWLLP